MDLMMEARPGEVAGRDHHLLLQNGKHAVFEFEFSEKDKITSVVLIDEKIYRKIFKTE